VISRSRSEAVRLGHGFIGTEHLLLGLLSNDVGMAIRVLESLEVDPEELRHSVVESIHRIPSSGNTGLNVGNLPLNTSKRRRC
jgi:ATP-dependent Clp protease ATP-binding subunit ClpC